MIPASMNFLAHAYLSFRQPELLMGNLFSDFVKGKAQFNFPEGIQRGIRLHRAIDSFTDDHPVTAEAKKVFRPIVGLYAGAFVDVVYDHFLATDPIAFPGENALMAFSSWVYETIGRYESLFPPRFAMIFPSMKTYDWLSNYRHRWGIERSLEGLVRRARYLEDSGPAYKAFEENYGQLEKCYQLFFPELLLFANDYYRQLLQGPENP
jgi:acyl carrier protein phosphodiesterase